MSESSEKLNISFKKIAAHTGNKYNEEADKLAKAALTDGKGIPKIKRGDFWFTVDDIQWCDLKVILNLLEEEFGAGSLKKEEKGIAYGRSVALKLGNKDKIMITHYDKGNKLVMQGKPKQLFSTILSYVTELVEVEKIPQIFNDTYKINIDKDEVYTYLMTIFRMGTTKLHQFSLPIEGGYTSQKIRGDQCLVPDLSANKAALKKFLFKS